MTISYVLPNYVTEEMVYLVLARTYGMPLKNNKNLELDTSEINLAKFTQIFKKIYPEDKSVEKINNLHGVDVSQENLIIDSEISNSLSIVHMNLIYIYDLNNNIVAEFYLSYKKQSISSYLSIEKNVGLLVDAENSIEIIGADSLVRFFGGTLITHKNDTTKELIIDSSHAIYQPRVDMSFMEKKSLFEKALRSIPILDSNIINRHQEYLSGFKLNNLLEMQVYREKEIMLNKVKLKEEKNTKILKF